MKGDFVGKMFYSLEEAQEFYDIHSNSATLWRENWTWNYVFPGFKKHDTIIKEQEIILERIKIDVTN